VIEYWSDGYYECNEASLRNLILHHSNTPVLQLNGVRSFP
jgi:hypothetical protein